MNYPHPNTGEEAGNDFDVSGGSTVVEECRNEDDARHEVMDDVDIIERDSEIKDNFEDKNEGEPKDEDERSIEEIDDVKEVGLEKESLSTGNLLKVLQSIF